MSKRVYRFETDTVIPFSAFNTFGINAKPNSSNPIGFFGTGLKYGVSIILRLGGTMRVFIDGTEYEFFLSSKDFRGKHFQEVRMKKRSGLLSKWQYDKLPFTTELGKNWELWQAYRELESNTRDENGISRWVDEPIQNASSTKGKTVIEISCRGLDEVIDTANTVFLDTPMMRVVHECNRFVMYDAPSKHLYYRGVRVYDLRYPSRYTYNFKQGFVELSEDRTARNSYMLFWYIAQQFMTEVHSENLLFKALSKSKDGKNHFEGYELNFSDPEYGMSSEFRRVSESLKKNDKLSYAPNAYYSLATSFSAGSSGESVKASLEQHEWNRLIEFLDTYNTLLDDDDQHELMEVVRKLKEQVYDGE